MAKCPKCGSEDIIFLRNQYGYLNEYECNICSYHLTEKECTEFDYQQRLTKVLEKFDKAIIGIGVTFNPSKYIHIMYLGKKFVLNGRMIISLDTVESLIKDMEAQNE